MRTVWQKRARRRGRCLKYWTSAVGFSSLILLTPSLVIHPIRDPRSSGAPEKGKPSLASVVPVTLRRGETLMAVLMRFGLGRTEAHAMIETVRPFVNPRRLRAGDGFRLILHPEEKRVQGFEYVLDRSLLRVTSTPEGWAVERSDIPFVRENKVIRGNIAENLYESGLQSGLNPSQILELATIFEFDIDFFSDFQRGHGFSLAFEQLRYVDGRTETGRLLAAEVQAGDAQFQAFYFFNQDGQGSYYGADGRSLRKTFLRAPLSYRRISSSYNLNRRHPIFRTLRPHRAIDYAAPAGTPVVAIGSGKVSFAGWQGGYGNLVEVKHANGYVTRYAHFSRIARGIGKGKQVVQGDVVGYVGETGHATGPHLHFEMLRGGEKINFLALRIPRTEQLKGGDLERFARLRDERLAFLQDKQPEVARAVSIRGRQ
jgi:murein DD-endopeptidase MepM/ murein hydrolase activator NlpD